jgi:pre-60S factor REI1
LDSEIFAEKVVSAQAKDKENQAKATFEKSCQACQKSYYSENAFRNHIGSQKHKLNVASKQSGDFGDGTGSIASGKLSFATSVDDKSTVKADSDSDSEEDVSKVAKDLKDSTLSDKAAESTEDPVYDLSKCLFCNYKSPSLSLNVNHMSKIHGMFIPEKEYLSDLDGLITYFNRKIYEYNECLYCGKFKNTSEGIQTHMRDKGHCMVAFSSEDEMLEIGEYYDFRSTYSDDEDDDEEDEEDEEEVSGGRRSGGVKLGAKRDAKVQGGEEEGEGWETDSDASSLDSDDIGAVPVDHEYRARNVSKHRHHAHQEKVPHRNKDGFHSHAHEHRPGAVFYSDLELHLPSGRIAGHRSLKKYFTQNLPHRAEDGTIIQRAIEDTPMEGNGDAEGRGRQGREAQLAIQRQGGYGMVGVSDIKRKEVNSIEKRERRAAERAQRRYQWGNNKQSNMQKHFRDPLLQ